MKFNIAADPELFVTKDNQIDSFAGVLGHTKCHKLEMDGFRLQEDNVLLEFDIDPCECITSFESSIQKALRGAKTVALQNGMGIVTDKCSHQFSPDRMQSFDKGAFIFGCDPDYNVINGRRNPTPKAGNLRTAGGHVHIGIEGATQMNGKELTNLQRKLGTLCDVYLGLPSVIEDGDQRRRQLYGKAGAVRFKPYGIEYRTLSNYWVGKREDNRNIYRRVETLVSKLEDDTFKHVMSVCNHKEVQDVINTGDSMRARILLGQLLSNQLG